MQGRYRDSASAARLRAHPSVHARPRPQPAGLARRRVERDLYWVIDAVYQSAFLDDDEGVSGGFMTTTSRTAAQPAPGAARRGTHPGIALAVIAGAQLMVVLDATIFAEGPARNRAFGVFAAVSGSGAAVGLLLGGMLTSWLSWRWVLFVNVP